MGCMVYRLAIGDDQYLGRLMGNFKAPGHLIADGAVRQQVKVIDGSIAQLFFPLGFQTFFYRSTDNTGCRMLKQNHL